MKKQIAILIVCLVFAVGLGGALWFLMGYEPAGGESSSSQVSETVQLLDRTAYDLDTVTVENETGTFTVKNLGESNYTLVGFDDVALNNSMLSSVANAAVQLSATSAVKENAEDLAAFGLTSPRAKFTAKYTDGSTFTLELGDDAPGNNGTYAKLGGEQTVYLLSTYTLNNLYNGALAFIDKTIVSPPEGTTDQQGGTSVLPDKVTLAGSLRPEPIVVTMDDPTDQQKSLGLTTYMMTSPKTRAVDTGESTEALAALMSISADAVAAYKPTAEQIKAYGLDAPYSTVSFSYKDAEGKSYSVGLSLSAADSDGKAYMMKDGVPLVYQITVSRLGWYGLTYPDMVSSLQLLPFIDNVGKITLASPSASYVFTLEGTDDELKAACNGQEVDTDKFRSFYQTIIGVPSEEFTSDTPPDVSEALLSITYEYRDSATPSDTCAFLPGPTRKVFVSINGESEFYTKSSYVDIILENAANITTDAEIRPLY